MVQRASKRSSKQTNGQASVPVLTLQSLAVLNRRGTTSGVNEVFFYWRFLIFDMND